MKKKKILFGSLIAVIILVLVSITPSINANADTLSVETQQEEIIAPIVLVLQLMTKLRNHKDIENIESENEVLRIIEQDEELNAIVEKLKSYDCGCDEDSSSLEWRYPVLCTFLYPLSIIAVGILFAFHIWIFFEIMTDIGIKLDCFWI